MKKNPTIAFITPLYLPAHISGSQTFVRIVAEALVGKGFDVTVITSDARTPRYWYDPLFGRKLSRKHDMINGVSVYRLRSVQVVASIAFILTRFMRLFPVGMHTRLTMLANGPYLFGLGNLLKQKKFDVIHVSPFPLGLNMQTVRCISGLLYRPTVMITPFFHAHVPDFYNPQLQSVFDAADIIHVISEPEKDDILGSFRVNSEKLHVVPLCLDTKSMYTGDSLREDVRRLKIKYGLNNRKIVLFAGIKGKGKGALDTLRAVYELWQKDPAYICVAMGTPMPEWDAYVRLVDPGCLLDLPYKTGREKEAFFAMADVYCMPSSTETFGLTYVEAWHKKKPVIGADFPPVSELIVKNSGGITVPYGNVHALKMALTKLVQNPVLSKELGIHGYNALMRRYTLSDVLPVYLRLFKGE